jgi:hypothetical protein
LPSPNNFLIPLPLGLAAVADPQPLIGHTVSYESISCSACQAPNQPTQAHSWRTRSQCGTFPAHCLTGLPGQGLFDHTLYVLSCDEHAGNAGAFPVSHAGLLARSRQAPLRIALNTYFL